MEADRRGIEYVEAGTGLTVLFVLWDRDGTLGSLAETFRNYVRKTAPVNMLDWPIDFGFDAVRRQCAAFNVPVLVRGAMANPAMVAVTEALQRDCRTHLPRSGSRPFPRHQPSFDKEQ